MNDLYKNEVAGVQGLDFVILMTQNYHILNTKFKTLIGTQQSQIHTWRK